MTKQGIENNINAFDARNRRKRLLMRVFAVCAVIVAFFTIYALVLPGVTMEQRDAMCGKQEHLHTQACYERTLTCELPEAKVHVHTPACYNEADKLVCAETPAAHMHRDSCYAKGGELKCQNQDPAHSHTAECYAKEGDVICPEEEAAHIHRATCFNAGGVLTCRSAAAHVHGDTCYDEAGQLVCTEQGVGHVHCNACWQRAGDLVCTQTDPAHVHDATCYAAADALICGQEEGVSALHVHGDGCYGQTLICEREEHAHDEVCYDAETYQMIQAGEANKDKLEGEGSQNAADPNAVDDKRVVATYETDTVKMVFEAPEGLEGDLSLEVVAVDPTGVIPASALDDEELSEEGAANDAESDEEAATDEAAEEGTVDEGASGDEAAGEDAGDASEGATGEEGDAADGAASAPAAPLWATGLAVQATLDGQPVKNIADLGLTAHITVKSQAIAPIIETIDYNEVAEEAKADIGAQITVIQTPAEILDIPLSERPEGSVDTVVFNDANNASLTLPVDGQTMEVQGRKTANPNFTVHYVADLEIVQTSDTKDWAEALHVIDTKGGVLPTNAAAKANSLKSQYVKLEGSTSNLSVATAVEEKEIFTPESYTYIKAPNASYFNKVYENSHYQLIEIHVKQPGETSYTVYADPSAIHFTNKPETASSADYILIQEGTDIKMKYKVTTGDIPVNASFYDYDISDGQIYASEDNAAKRQNGKPTSSQTNSDAYANTWYYGINSQDHYTGTGAKYGFGNANAGTDSSLTNAQVSGFNINKGNAVSSDESKATLFQKCSFGIVSGISDTGGVTFASGIQGPDIFGKDDFTGKTTIGGNHTLTFNRAGDTYELVSAQVSGSSLNGLNTFKKSNGVAYGTSFYQYTNGFWAVDSASTFGADGHDLKFGNTALESKRHFTNKWGLYNYNKLPPSDDGKDHNSYFGMQSQVNFHLLPDYCGPLDYFFFGDDDMWVFLIKTDEHGNMLPGSTPQLICDIGGVHQTTGEMIDLRDYLPLGSEGHYALRFYYTERGASGSTCYMRFTLPSVTNSNPPQDTGTVRVEKKVSAAAGSADLEKEFEFSIGLTDDAGNQLQDDYSYTRYDSQGRELESDIIIWNGGSFHLRNGEYVIIRYLPVGSRYYIQEQGTVKDDGTLESLEGGPYEVSYEYLENNEVIASAQADKGAISPIYEGVIYQNNSATLRKVVFTNTVPYELPATGGIGTAWFFIVGAGLIGAAVVVLWRKQQGKRASGL